MARQNPCLVTPQLNPNRPLHWTLPHPLPVSGFSVIRVQEHGGGDPILPFSGVLEGKLADMPEDEGEQYCKANEISSALPKIIKTGFTTIHLVYFFTCGPDEVCPPTSLLH